MKTITAFVVRAIGFCTLYPRRVIVGAIIVTIVSSWYAATHFSVTTDINQLLSTNSPGRQRELAFEKAFPQFDTIVAVVDAPTPGIGPGSDRRAGGATGAGEEFFQIDRSSCRAARFLRRTACCSRAVEQLGPQMKCLRRRSGSFRCWPAIRACAA